MGIITKLIAPPLTLLTAGVTGGVVFALLYSSNVEPNNRVIPPRLYNFDSETYLDSKSSSEKDNLVERRALKRKNKVYLDGFTVRLDVPKTLNISKRELTTRYVQSFFTTDLFNLERKLLSKAKSEIKYQEDKEILDMKFETPEKDVIAGTFALEHRQEGGAWFEWSFPSKDNSVRGKTFLGVKEADIGNFRQPSQYFDEYELVLASSLLLDRLSKDSGKSIVFSLMLPFHKIYSRLLLQFAATRLQRVFEEEELALLKQKQKATV
mmetsp:Transcript_17426/g.21459  ORF Transcript_17426/g.21459 Transcript_17426/m.21459 type:complete len:266 (+) Transcript_17426:67-864(+)|eukprot:CAMPEP_0204825778 /NCGR_PEP_ID=MMETSP1346-20131115/3585_1 /ASSEMBLY_ACC=CAM_ASM_000771 /TAXON_ID=215587 /ORGANISM="Aplanochytrium stocchinoi, Strain GSBS06" /LENGTH=265 /DNA_ID=CAMNT_0051953515 /DNA_START=174 /DNA_END=971 /DNA_ORIENTATION=-